MSRDQSKYYNGYRGPSLTKISPSESIDINESFAWRYEPSIDPLHNPESSHPFDTSQVPPEVFPWLRAEPFVWEGTKHLPEFKSDVLKYWQSCLSLARSLVKIFALSLDLEENWFDDKTTYPGADGVFNFYPVRSEEQRAKGEVGLGSHTDLQLFTLL